MQLFAKYGIRVRLALVFGVLIVVSASAGLYGTVLSQSLAQQRQEINEVNYANSNAVRDIRTALFRMHRSMKDAALSQKPDEAATALGMVTKDDQFVIKNLNQLQRTYIGDPLVLNALRDDFVVWRAIRQRVATLQDEGRKAEAISITRRAGADHVDKLDRETRDLIAAIAEAHQGAEQTITAQQRRMSRSLAGILLGAALLTLSTGLHTGYRLLQPLQVLVRFANEIRQGELERRLNLQRDDEVGTLAAALDSMADGIQNSQRDLLASRDDLERRVRDRTAELTAAHDELDMEFKVREKIAARLLQSEERLEMMMTGANDGFWDWLDVHQPALWWSPRVYDMIHQDQDIFHPTMPDAMSICHPDDRERVTASIDITAELPDEIDEEFRIVDGLGEVVWVHMRGRVFRDSSGKPARMSGSFRDISQAKWAEAELQTKNGELAALNKRLQSNQNQLIQSEKMSSLGQLAAGIAHEINNPVGFVSSNLGTMREYSAALKSVITPLLAATDKDAGGLSDPAIQLRIQEALGAEDFGFVLEDIDQLLTESLNGTERITSIVQSLKSFARPDEDTMQPAQINEGLESSLRMVWNTIKYKCEVEKDLVELPVVYCNIGRLNQVFMNLIVNASHAIQDRGQLTLRTRHENGSIVIQIADNGNGIPADIQKSIFDPFFTTKPVGQGTGLGLSISHGIVEDHQGSISVESAEGQGTTFTIRIPDDLSQPDLVAEALETVTT